MATHPFVVVEPTPEAPPAAPVSASQQVADKVLSVPAVKPTNLWNLGRLWYGPQALAHADGQQAPLRVVIEECELLKQLLHLSDCSD